jgi:hypothetical protein
MTARTSFPHKPNKHIYTAANEQLALKQVRKRKKKTRYDVRINKNDCTPAHSGHMPQKITVT